MKQFYSTDLHELPRSLLKSFCLTATVLMLVSGTAFSQENPEQLSGKSLSHPAPVQSFLPGTLVNWNAKLDKNKVVLNWTTTIEMNSRHFTIEKSFDGVEYTDAAVLSAAGNSGKRKDYAFTEKLSNNANGIIYYRLKLIDSDANTRYSDVRTVRGMGTEEIKLEVYPNPTTNDLKVTVGASWVNDKLTLQVYNLNGVLLKSKISQKAKESEVVDVRDLATGVYLVKVSNGSESSLQRFIKN